LQSKHDFTPATLDTSYPPDDAKELESARQIVMEARRMLLDDFIAAHQPQRMRETRADALTSGVSKNKNLRRHIFLGGAMFAQLQT
jgi:hypothetical protein